MKFKVYNNDSRFGDESAEYFNTIEEAEKSKSEYENQLYEVFAEEIKRRALEEFMEDIYHAIEIEEIEEEKEE